MKFRPPIVFSIVLLTWIGGAFVAAQKLSTIDYKQAERLSIMLLLFDESSFVALLILSSCSFFLLFIGSRPIYAMVTILIPWLGFVYSAVLLPGPKRTDIYWLKNSRFVEIIATVESQKNKYNTIVRIEEQTYPTERKLSGKSLLILPRFKTVRLQEGSCLRIRGKVKSFKRVKFAWQLDKRTYLRKNGIYSKIHSTEIEELSKRKTVHKGGIKNSRELIIKNHRLNLGDTKGDLLSSIVLGDRAVNLEYGLKKSFQKTGLSHLLAASGFNLSILVGSIYLVSSLFTKSKSLVATITLVSIVGFVSLAGTGPSVLRAAIMSSVFVLSTMSYRKCNTLALLSFTLFCFSVFNPASLLDVGLQLSFAATFSIVIGIKIFGPIIAGLNTIKPIKWLLELTSVILLAQAAVLPIQLFYFWELGFFFLIANLLVDPVVAPITVCGFASSILIMLSPVIPKAISGNILNCAALADQTVYFPLAYMIMVAEKLGAVEGSTICLGPPALWNIFIYYVSLGFLIHSFERRAFLPLSICLFAVSCSMFFMNRQESDCVIVSKNNLALYDHATKKVLSKNTKDFRLNRFLKYNGINPVNSEIFDFQTRESRCYKAKPIKMKGVESQVLSIDTKQLSIVSLAKTRGSGISLIPLGEQTTEALLKSNSFSSPEKPTLVLTKAKSQNQSSGESRQKKLFLVNPRSKGFIKIDF